MIWIAVALGGAIGAPSRFLVDAFVSRRSKHEFPLGTVLVNLSGAAILGIFGALFYKGILNHQLFALFGTGFCGAYTTFSTFIWETVALAEYGKKTLSVANIVLTTVAGIAMIAAAFAITSAIA